MFFFKNKNQNSEGKTKEKNDINISEYVIRNEFIEVRFLNYGGRITSITSPKFVGNMLLSYNTPFSDDEDEGTLVDTSSYQNDNFYLGALVGRYANRIKDGEFELNNQKYILDKNDNGTNCLHGGNNGYSSKIFNVESSYSSATLSLYDNEGQFPGNLDVKIKYSVLGSAFVIQYSAIPDKPTVINLTNHMYFDVWGDMNSAECKFNSVSFTPIGENMIPTGEILSVKNTPFDFSSRRKVGKYIDSDDEQISKANGYDHNFVICESGNIMNQAAKVYLPNRNVTLSVSTSQKGFQFYTGNFLSEPFSKREGFCIETQNFPDAPNKKNFPNCVFSPERPYKSKTVYRFESGDTVDDD